MSGREIKIIIKTVSQEIELISSDQFTLEQVLRLNGLPTTLFQAYVKDRRGKLFPVPTNKHLGDLEDDQSVVLQCVRNTDLKQVIPQKSFQKESVEKPIIVVKDLDFVDDECVETVSEISQTDALNIVESQIGRFMDENSKADKVVAGISGGGDSNTLVRSLKKRSDQKGAELTCFTLVLDPIWPASGARRASELCEANQVEHVIYQPEDIEKLLDMKGSLEDFYIEFSKIFGEQTSHFLATYLISLVARKLCKKNNTTEYCLGFNREDVLAELMFSLMNGHSPLSFPTRDFGKIRLLMPLWRVPKIMLDACYPDYSLENYKEREDKTTFQRGIIYYIAHGIGDVYNNLDISIMEGTRKLFDGKWQELEHHDDLDLYISEHASSSSIKASKDLLKKYFKKTSK